MDDLNEIKSSLSKIHLRLDRIEKTMEQKFKHPGGHPKVPIPQRVKQAYNKVMFLRKENLKLHRLLARQL